MALTTPLAGALQSRRSYHTTGHVCGPSCSHTQQQKRASVLTPADSHICTPTCSHNRGLAYPTQVHACDPSCSHNRGVVYMGPGEVAVQDVGFPKLERPPDHANPRLRKCNHGVILKIVTTNICGSDLHMLHGRTSAKPGLILGHEITGEIVELGSDVEYLNYGDIVSVPFNVACGRCPNCKAGKTEICLNVNPLKPGGAYGYAEMGNWAGGQSEYVMVPYADFNLLKFPDRDQALEKIKDLTMLSDIFPTGFHGAVTAGVGPGTTVYIAGAGPVGLAAAVSANMLGAACVIVGDLVPERLQLAKKIGCETVDVSSPVPVAEQINNILGTPQVDCGVDAVGFEARGCGREVMTNKPAEIWNELQRIVKAGGAAGMPGVYFEADPGAPDPAGKAGMLSVQLGLGWSKSVAFHTGQCPVMRYHRPLMNAILNDKVKIADALNVELISLDDAPRCYNEYNHGAPKKFVIDPHHRFIKK